MGSETEDVEPSGAVWLDDHCNLRVGDEVEEVSGDDEGGEGVLGVDQCLAFNSCPALQGRNKQDTLQTIRQLQCGFSGSSPMVCCPASLPRKAVEDGGNPALVNVDVNSRTNLDIGGLNARTGNFPLSREETTLWSEEF